MFPHFFFYNLTTARQCIVAATYTRSLDLAPQLVGNYRAPTAGFQGAASRQGKGGEKEEEEKGRGIVFLHFFFYNLTTAQQCIVAATYTRSLDLAPQLVCRAIFATKTKTRTKMIAIHLLKLKLELNNAKKN